GGPGGGGTSLVRCGGREVDDDFVLEVDCDRFEVFVDGGVVEQDDEDDVAGGDGCGDGGGRGGAGLDMRFGLGGGAVPHGGGVAGLAEAFGDGRSHRAEPEDGDVAF